MPAPPGGRAHLTESPSDLDFEQGVIVAMERLAAGRELVDDLGKPVDRYERSRLAGRRAAGYAGLQARIRPHLRGSHPWVKHARELVERLAAEEAYWWSVEGRKR